MLIETLKTFYKIDGVPFTRVSTILGQLDKSGPLIHWALNCAEQYIKENLSGTEPVFETVARAKKEFRNVSQKALDIGSEIHHIIERYIKSGRDAVGELKPEVENGFLAFLDWEQKNAVKWLESEVFVFSEWLQVAGTFDAICEIGGKKYLIDFKSSKAVYDEYLLQVCAYALMYRERTGEQIKNLGILRLDKETGEPEFVDITAKYGTDKVEKLTKAFECLAKFYYLFKEGKAKRTKKEATK